MSVAQQLTGWNQNDAFGEMIENVFCIVNEYTRVKTENPIRSVFETEEIVQLANHTLLISKDGTGRAIEDTAAPIKDKFGKVIGCVLVFRDFSEKKEKQRQIEYSIPILYITTSRPAIKPDKIPFEATLHFNSFRLDKTLRTLDLYTNMPPEALYI